MTTSDEEQFTLLELLNTTPLVDDRVTEMLDADWLRVHGVHDESVLDSRRLRDDLQRVVRKQADPDALARYLHDVAQTPKLGATGVSWTLAADWPARMVLAWGRTQSEHPGRLRPCANGECHLFLFDSTRAGTARWCSMKVCGNRMKARRHYVRTTSG
jgi:predicted RNA-binding Zn ribbon-like protein